MRLVLALGGPFAEPPELAQLHRRCLDAYQLHFASVAELPRAWRSHPLTPGLVGELRRVLARVDEVRSSVAALLLPLYEEALGGLPGVTLCVVDPWRVVREPLIWEAGPGTRAVPALGAAGFGVWLRHTLAGLAVDGVRVEAPNGPFSGPALVEETYALCQSLARGEPMAGRAGAMLREFADWRAMLAPPGIPGTQIGFAWDERGVAQVSQVPFLPSGDWQTVRVPIGARAATEVFGLMYGRPCRVWIRRFEWISPGGREAARLKAGPGSRLSEVAGVVRLDGAYEPSQIRLQTPTAPGPYELEIEFLLESAPQITLETVHRLVGRLA